MENLKTNNNYNWLIWSILLIAVLLLALWSRSCSTFNQNQNNSYGLCSNIDYDTKFWGDTITLDSVSLEKLYKNIRATGDLDSLQGMECLEYLTIPDDGRRSLKDISAMKYLPNLKTVYLDNIAVTDISPISQLDKLEVLMLNNINISNINPLQTSIANLKFLGLSNTKVDDISLLIDAVKLETLNLTSTFITDLSPLYDLPSLKFLILRDTAFSKLWYRLDIIPKELDKQLQELQTRHPDLEIQFTQFDVISGEDTLFENWKYHLNHLNLPSFL